MKCKLIFIALVSFIVTASAQQVRIAVFYADKPNKLVCTIAKGNYSVQSGDSVIGTLPAKTPVHISYLAGKILLQYGDTILQCKPDAYLSGDTGAEFILNTAPAKGADRNYEGSLQVKYQDGYLLAINCISLEQYVAAVTETEGGYKKPAEFYKSQAIITRTYALKNFERHKQEGFELCDGTHCQAYKKKCTSPDIVAAVNATQGLVLVNDSYELIMAAYHSNSGGVTMNSEDVWISALSYLRSVNDKYYVYGRNAVWQKNITVEQWKSFLKTKGVDINVSIDSLLITETGRVAKANIRGKSFPMTEVRHYFKLPSAFLNMSLNGDNIQISGKGYGHGVGLSQESAMRMAEEGLTYKEILPFFYSGVHVVNMKTLSVFKSFQEQGE